VLDAARGHLCHEPQRRILEVVLLERIAPAQPTLLNIDRLGVRLFFSPVPRDEARLTIVAMNLQGPRTDGRPGEWQPGLRV
jgi:hypothetical protein